MSNTFICDGNSLYARAWYAAQSTSPDPREAIRLAVNSVLLLLDHTQDKIGVPFDRTLFAWDGNQNKAKGRDPKPQIYHGTMSVLKDVLSYLLGTVHAVDEVAEGDDIVATAVAQEAAANHTYVISSDKDLMQLVGANCHYYSLIEKAVLTPSFIIHKFHNIKRPEQVSIELAIVGDPVDNIKGVHRYGEKKCRQLFEAVTKDMDFDSALAAITAQLPAQQRAEFDDAFVRTQLNRRVAGVPAPAPLSLVHPNDVKVLELPQIEHYYRQLWRAYD